MADHVCILCGAPGGILCDEHAGRTIGPPFDSRGGPGSEPPALRSGPPPTIEPPIDSGLNPRYTQLPDGSPGRPAEIPPIAVGPPLDSETDDVWCLVDGEWFYRRARSTGVAVEPPTDSAFVLGLDRDNPHGQSVFASATDRSSAAAATPTAPIRLPSISDLREGLAEQRTWSREQHARALFSIAVRQLRSAGLDPGEELRQIES